MAKKNVTPSHIDTSFMCEFEDEDISERAVKAIVDKFSEEFNRLMSVSNSFKASVIDLGKVTSIQISVKVSEVSETTNRNPRSLKYEEYIKSKEWFAFRASIFNERGFNCELCESKKNIQLHHLTYENFGAEKDEDVMILCKTCHEKAHGRKFNDGKNIAAAGWAKV